MINDEHPLDPDRAIIDPHLHFWEILELPDALQAPQRFLFEEGWKLVEASGHNITHSVFVECHAMYRDTGPADLRSLGETEFANGIAAISASGRYGPRRLAHRIVGNVDLRSGARTQLLLEAHLAAAGERFCGVRMNTAWSEHGLFGLPCDPSVQGIFDDPKFREGAQVLSQMGLTLDVWCLHTQIPEVVALADAVPQLTIILDHAVTLEPVDFWAGGERETQAEWAEGIRELARRPNVLIKLGGLGMDLSGPLSAIAGSASSEELSDRWRPMFDTCIAAFSPNRAMFESNFPPDQSAGSYGATWNAFKRIAADFSEDEKDALFRRTAARAYRIELTN